MTARAAYAQRTPVLPGLLLPAILLFVGPAAVVLNMQRAQPRPTLIAGGVGIVLLALLTPVAMRLAHRRWDPVLIGSVWGLAALSLVAVARVAPELIERQMLWIALGWLVFVVLCAIPGLTQIAGRYKYTWFVLGMGLAILTFAFGTGPVGSNERLWLEAGPFRLQPSELLRIVFVVFLAGYLTSRQRLLTGTMWRIGPLSLPRPEHAVPLLAMVGLALLLVVFQHDLGPALLLVATFLVLLYLAIGRLDLVFIGAAMFLLASVAAYHISGHVHARIDAWLDPWNDPGGLGYQSLQAIGGMAYGGIAGTGPGYGYPTLIPAAHTDYPFAVIGEEWGLLGTAGVVLLYALLVTRAVGIVARSARDPFALLLGAGLAVSIGLQALLAVGAALRVLPIAGLTSPFLSYGGSSMLMNWAGIALILAAADGASNAAASVGINRGARDG